MKKGWKIFLIVCASVFVTGLALCITGAAMGATFMGVSHAFGYDSYTWDDYDDTYDHDDDYDYDTYDDDDYDTEGKSNGAVTVEDSSKNTFTFSGIKEIDVDMSYIEIDVKTYDEDVIKVDTSGLKNGLKKYVICTPEGSELKIETTNQRKWERYAHKSPGRLVMWIPKNLVFSEASFDVGAGYLKIEDIEAREMSINVGAGKTVIKNFITDNLDVESAAGQSIMAGTVKGSADVECGVGETKLTLNGEQKDYDYQLKCDVGQLIVGSDKYTGVGSEQRINNGTGKEIDIDCGVGNVEVSFNPQN